MGDLNMPGFSDFLAEMGEARVVKWSSDALRDVRRDIGLSFDLSNPDDAARFVTAMQALNQRTTVLMLQDYHDWFCRLLAQRSVRLL